MKIIISVDTPTDYVPTQITTQLEEYISALLEELGDVSIEYIE